jgi:hypothetical protein
VFDMSCYFSGLARDLTTCKRGRSDTRVVQMSCQAVGGVTMGS